MRNIDRIVALILEKFNPHFFFGFVIWILQKLKFSKYMFGLTHVYVFLLLCISGTIYKWFFLSLVYCLLIYFDKHPLSMSAPEFCLISFLFAITSHVWSVSHGLRCVDGAWSFAKLKTLNSWWMGHRGLFTLFPKRNFKAND